MPFYAARSERATAARCAATTHEGHVEVDREVDAANLGLARSGEVLERDEIGLSEGRGAVRLVGRGLDLGRAGVAEDSRVDAAVEASRADAGVRADPVVVDRLVSGEL